MRSQIYTSVSHLHTLDYGTHNFKFLRSWGSLDTHYFKLLRSLGKCFTDKFLLNVIVVMWLAVLIHIASLYLEQLRMKHHRCPWKMQ